MIDGKRVLGIILARGGSKGLPGKNIMELKGRPLIAWTIKAAQDSRVVDRLILSTDDDEIAEAGRIWGAETPFMRPPKLASDEASSIHAIHHAMNFVAAENQSYDYIILLQATSPLRSGEDIAGCLRLCHDQQAPTAVSVTKSSKSPHWMYYRQKDGTLKTLIEESPQGVRRQDLPDTFSLNGAVYCAQWDVIMQSEGFMFPQTQAYPMPEERSVDIDTELDFAFCEVLAERIL